ncbi:hypothetical protein CMV_024828 [Castanea mollissima]|uniref:Uncharacterized protein n=1 Tax=Castanea mollissima TaxID=60419 RepID=A0A8J4QA53_9ROSI|nr:hypothetical protein CMV_024828 [Castanea mollissima]
MSSVKRDTIGLHFVNNDSTFCSLPDPNAKNIPCFSDGLVNIQEWEDQHILYFENLFNQFCLPFNSI